VDKHGAIDMADFTATELGTLTEREREMVAWVVPMFHMPTTHEAIAYARELLTERQG
jgi:hypothetical protein